MLYSSTRGGCGECTSAEAIVQGLSPDGGLFVPQSFPKIVIDELKLMAEETYADCAARIISKFLDDFSYDSIKKTTDNVYSKARFGTGEVAPVYKLSRDVYFLELWHGPTCAFKDIALQFLPHLMVMSLSRMNDTRTPVVLAATSGDTGKAALEGFCDVPGTKAVIFYPSSGISDIQRLQITTQKGSNLCAAGVKGSFGSLQACMKQIFLDESLRTTLSENNMFLSSANSINWGRLVPQVVYYFYSYASLFSSGEISMGEKINIAVPEGNFGNILSAYYAKLMGLPVNRLICASNSNDVLTEFISSGVYDDGRSLYGSTASSPADVLVPVNLERLIHCLSDYDCGYVKTLMDDLDSNGRYCVNDYIKTKVADTFWAGFCDDYGTQKAASSLFEEYGYLADPHTASAYGVYRQYVSETGDADTKTVISSISSPFKFAGFAGRSLGISGTSDDFELIERIADKAGISQPDAISCLKDSQQRFNDDIEASDMKKFISSFLGI